MHSKLRRAGKKLRRRPRDNSSRGGDLEKVAYAPESRQAVAELCEWKPSSTPSCSSRGHFCGPCSAVWPGISNLRASGGSDRYRSVSIPDTKARAAAAYRYCNRRSMGGHGLSDVAGRCLRRWRGHPGCDVDLSSPACRRWGQGCWLHFRDCNGRARNEPLVLRLASPCRDHAWNRGGMGS